MGKIKSNWADRLTDKILANRAAKTGQIIERHRNEEYLISQKNKAELEALRRHDRAVERQYRAAEQAFNVRGEKRMVELKEKFSKKPNTTDENQGPGL